MIAILLREPLCQQLEPGFYLQLSVSQHVAALDLQLISVILGFLADYWRVSNLKGFCCNSICTYLTCAREASSKVRVFIQPQINQLE
jgi:hypothetical protein